MSVVQKEVGKNLLLLLGSSLEHSGEGDLKIDGDHHHSTEDENCTVILEEVLHFAMNF
jgi:hypothetical protein